MTEQEYFTVHHALTVNVEPLTGDYAFPSYEQFVNEIPAPFIVASEFSQLDQLNDAAKLELKNSDFKHVVQLLDTQNAKLNLLLTFMLSQQDESQYRHMTTAFGASQLTYQTHDMLAVGTKLRIKLFLEHPAAAIYCYATVHNVEEKESGNIVTIKYDLLRETDQDLLIKAALYQQQKLLRQRSLDREKQ